MPTFLSGISSDKVQICKAGSVISEDDHTKISFDGDVCTLTFASAVAADTATYGIKVDNSVQGEIAAKVTAKPKAQVEVLTEGDVVAKEGEKVKLSWKISGSSLLHMI